MKTADLEYYRNIYKKIERVRMSRLGRDGAKSEIRTLELRRELIDKARYAYGHLEFDDPEFKHNNGIHVAVSTTSTFRITLYDLELSLKLLIGILHMLNNANARAAVKGA